MHNKSQNLHLILGLNYAYILPGVGNPESAPVACADRKLKEEGLLVVPVDLSESHGQDRNQTVHNMILEHREKLKGGLPVQFLKTKGSMDADDGPKRTPEERSVIPT